MLSKLWIILTIKLQISLNFLKLPSKKCGIMTCVKLETSTRRAGRVNKTLTQNNGTNNPREIQFTVVQQTKVQKDRREKHKDRNYPKTMTEPFQCPWTHHDWENTSSANTWLVSVTAAIRGDFSSHFGEANLCFLCLSQHDLFTHIWMLSNVWETWRGNIKKEETLFIIPSVTMADGLVKDTSFQGVCPCVCAITCVSQESTYQLIFNRQLGNKGNFSSAASVRSSGTANG